MGELPPGVLSVEAAHWSGSEQSWRAGSAASDSSIQPRSAPPSPGGARRQAGAQRVWQAEAHAEAMVARQQGTPGGSIDLKIRRSSVSLGGGTDAAQPSAKPAAEPAAEPFQVAVLWQPPPAASARLPEPQGISLSGFTEDAAAALWDASPAGSGVTGGLPLGAGQSMVEPAAGACLSDDGDGCRV